MTLISHTYATPLGEMQALFTPRGLSLLESPGFSDRPRYEIPTMPARDSRWLR